MDFPAIFEEQTEKIKGEKKEMFSCFYSLLKEYNACYNLTTILEEKEEFYKHFLDSLAGESLFEKTLCFCNERQCGDFGTIRFYQRMGYVFGIG